MKYILAVDDDPDILEIVSEVLEEEGFGVITAEDGEEFERVLKKTTPDLVLMDVHLPGESGVKLSQTLKKNSTTKDVPVILMSSFDNLHKVAMRANVNSYLEKPFDISELVEMVEKELMLTE